MLREAGVGSAIGFLKAPFDFEAVASRLVRLSAFAAVNDLVSDLAATARPFVRDGTDGTLSCQVTAFMRYVGQGWDIPVPLPDRSFDADDAGAIRDAFRERYADVFGRAIDGLVWGPATTRAVFDPARGAFLPTSIIKLGTLAAIMIILGYPGEVSSTQLGRWIWWALAMIPFLIIGYDLFVGLGNSIAAQPKGRLPRIAPGRASSRLTLGWLAPG